MVIGPEGEPYVDGMPDITGKVQFFLHPNRSAIRPCRGKGFVGAIGIIGVNIWIELFHCLERTAAVRADSDFNQIEPVFIGVDRFDFR